VDIERLISALLAVVENTVQPEQASLWLRPATDSRPRTVDGIES
jgi:hypothetical protein